MNHDYMCLVDNFSSDEFCDLVAKSTNWSELARKCGYRHPSSRKVLKERVALEACDTSHFTIIPKFRKYDTATILVQDSPYKSTRNLKLRLIKEGLLEGRCHICKLNTWLDKPITLELDHINGNNSDNRIENLRILCPNCHAQTDTYKGKNVQHITTTKRCGCGKEIGKTSQKCCQCTGNERRKFNPSYDELYQLIHIEKCPMVKIAQIYSVSDNAVRKRCRILGLSYK